MFLSYPSVQKYNMKGSSIPVFVTLVYLLVSPTTQAFLYSSNDTSDNLQGVILIVQEGYTSIPSNETYPNDEYIEPEYWPDGFGQLTIYGKQQLYKLGQSIASKYADFLPTDPHKVFVQSFDDTPCFESAAVLAAGTFPPIGRWSWDEKLRWQPVKINTHPSSTDNVLGSSIPCEIPTLSNLQTKEAYIQLTNAHNNLLAFVADATGWTNMSIMQFVDLYKTIILEDNANLPRQPWLNKTVWLEMEEFVSDLAYLMYSNHEVQRTLAGPLLSQISKNIETIQKEDDPKVYIYVSKQPKLISLLTSLLINNTQEIVTKPGSVIGFEIYQAPGKEPYFHIVFNDGQKIESWKPLAMYGCNLDCSMDHFYRFTQFISPLTAQELCSQSDNQTITFPSAAQSVTENSETVPEEESSGGGWRAFFITILCLACIALIVFGVSHFMKNRQRVEYFFI